MIIKDPNLGTTVLVSDNTWLKKTIKIGSADEMLSNWFCENIADCLHFSLHQSDNK